MTYMSFDRHVIYFIALKYNKSKFTAPQLQLLPAGGPRVCWRHFNFFSQSLEHSRPFPTLGKY